MKRRIIARSTLEATGTDSPLGCLGRFKTLAILAAFTMASYLGAGIAANAASNSTASGSGEIKQVGYSAAKSSSKLKWLPYQSQAGDTEGDTTHTETVARWTPAVSTNNSQSAINDLSGDKASSVASESAEELSEPLILPSAGPSNGIASPKFRNISNSTNAKSLVAQQKENGLQYRPNGSRTPNAPDQTLEQALTAKNPDVKDGCPSVKDLKKISQLTTNITPSPGELPRDCPWGGDNFQSRAWSQVTFAWTASGLCNHPLYFEEVQVERYGHTLGPWMQPFASGAHFFLTLPILPYKMGLELPNECMYSLGYYRPGDCAPYLIDPLPLSIRAGVFEAGAWVGGAALIP
jgi:hypothetical protein